MDLSRYRLEFSELTSPDELMTEWVDLQERSDCSYFLTWGWIGTWLDQIAVDLRPEVMRIWLGDLLVGAGLFVSGDLHRRIIVRANAVFLNEYPIKGKNMFIEYNGLLADKDHRDAVHAKTLRHLLRNKTSYDEYHFGAVSDVGCIKELPDVINCKIDCIIEKEEFTWHVELGHIGEGLDAYLATLSQNRRWQISRSLRLYEKNGKLKLEEAENTEEALRFFDGLKELHTRRWESKGLSGSFGNKLWEQFHRNQIIRRFPEGEVQMLKVSNANGALGYLYNFVWRKRVYSVQSGFEIPVDNRLMPGYVIHALAIVYNKAKGMRMYDLMYGDSRYKRSLGNSSQKLYWVVLQRRRLRFVIERFMVGLVRSSRALTKKQQGINKEIIKTKQSASVELITSYDEFMSLSGIWNDLINKSRNNIVCLTHEWFASWWNAYGEGKSLFVILVKNKEGDLIGIAPMLLARERYRGILPVIKVRFIENDVSPRLDIISVIGEEENVIREVSDYLIDQKHLWDIIDLDKLRDGSIASKVIANIWDKSSLFYRVDNSLVSPYISVNSDWDTYYKSRSRKFRKNINNKINRIKKLGDITVERINTMPELKERLPELFSVSSRSWKSESGTAITSDPKDMAFYTGFTASAGDKGWIEMWFLRHKSTPIACEYHLVYENRVMIIRGDSDKSYDNVSPGSFLEYNIINTSFHESKITEYDFCGDNYKYMRNWTDKASTYKKMLLFNPRVVSRLLGFAECRMLPYIKKINSAWSD